MFNHHSQAEPYLPAFSEELLAQARGVVQDAQDLLRCVPRDGASEIFQLTSHMNAKYSNLLESETGEKFIESHQGAEVALDKLGSIRSDALCTATLQEIHRELFKNIHPQSTRPGEFRLCNVKVQKHVPPEWESVPFFLRRIEAVYWKEWKNPAQFLIVAAAAHHRLQWVHPFSDGNGRSIRLQSQLALRSINSQFWSLSRAFWNHRDAYYQMLAMADSPRFSDLDGRGNLSHQCLVDWCRFFIEICRSEIRLVRKGLT